MRLAALALFAAALATGGVIVAGPAQSQTDPGTAPVVFVANSQSGTVSVVDARTLTVNRTIDVLPHGEVSLTDPSLDRDPVQAANALLVNTLAGDNYAQDLDVSPDGTTLYVSRAHLKAVAAFDLTEPGTPMVWQTQVDGFRADHMTRSADGDRLFVSDLTEDQVVALDASDGTRLGAFPTGDYAHGVHTVVPASSPLAATAESETAVSTAGPCPLLPDTPPAERPEECVVEGSIGDIVLQPRPARDDRPDAVDAVANEPYLLTVADAGSMEVLRTLEFPDGIRPFHMVLTPEEQLLYYQESEFHGVVEYDLAEGEERRRVQLPVDDDVTGDDYSFEAPHHGLAASPDEAKLCAAGRASDYAAIVDRETMLPEHIVDVGDAPGWAVTGPLDRCWVSSAGSEAEDPDPGAHTVSVVTYDGQKEAVLDVGQGPKHLLPAQVPEAVLG